MPESEIIVQHREQLLYELAEAAEIEHGLMCCYLFAAWSLKRSESEGLTPDEAAAVARWRSVLEAVALDEMVHLALVANLTTAVGGGPHFLRPNFPVSAGYHPAGVVLRLARFDMATLDHFIFLERPEGRDMPDGEGFHPGVYVRGTRREALMPNAQDFETVGHLYRAIRSGLDGLSARMSERALFCGDEAAQVGADLVALPGIATVTNLKTARAALDFIVHQGEGSPNNPDSSHFRKFQGVRDEFARLQAARPGFEPARPVARNPVMRRPPDAADRVFVDAPEAACLLDLGNAAYGLMLRLLTRAFGQADDSPKARRALLAAAIDAMKIAARTGEALTSKPASDAHPGVTAGLSFAVSRSSDALTQRRASWTLLVERAHEIAARCDLARQHGSGGLDVSALGARIVTALEQAAEEPAPQPAAVAAALVTAAAPTATQETPGIEEVRGKKLVIRFEGKRCIHHRHCVLAAPTVFKANVQGPWIDPDGTTVEQLVTVARSCPSGAIKYERLDGGEEEPKPPVNVIRLRENGPLSVSADLRLAGRASELRATLCRCGASKNKPFCDGTHNTAGFVATGEPATRNTDALEVRDGPLEVTPQPNGPLLVSGNVEICCNTGRIVTRTRGAALCRCGGSANKPFCDGTHARNGFVAPG